MGVLRHHRLLPSSYASSDQLRGEDETIVETDPDNLGAGDDLTVPDTIARLDVEDQAMFRQVFASLFGSEARRERVGRYELRRMIASGGMGVVYRAFDPELERDVAIKLVSPRPGRDVELLREHLQREARVLARLEHPNVVSAYDVGVDEGRVFLAMELIVGVTLRERQSREGCSLRERLRLYIDAGRGLGAAHEAGVVHRDFKPENVFIDEHDGVHVGDFGLARFGEAGTNEAVRSSDFAEAVAARLTQSGGIQGTLAYMAPEQLRGDQTGATVDQFAFCVALWESISGQLPFVGPTPEACLEAMRGLPRGAELVPRRLRRLLRVGLAATPEARYPSMAELLEALEREYERPARLAWRGLVSSLGALALGGLGYAYVLHDTYVNQEPAPAPSCTLLDTLDDPHEHEHWAELERTAGPRLGTRVDALLAQAAEACARGDDEDPELRHIVDQVKHVLNRLDRLPNIDHAERSAFIRELNLALASRWSQPTSAIFGAFLGAQVEPLEIAWDSAAVLDALDQSEPSFKTDRAELLLRRGRAHALLGEHELALADYRQARNLARQDPVDEERELRAYIGLTKTSIMRAGRLEAGGELLALSLELPAVQDRTPDDAFRLALRELEAVLARHVGDLDRALVLQQAVLADLDPEEFPFERVAALVNLGNIHQSRGDIDEAERSYVDALEIDPEEPEALLNFGGLLVNGNDEDRYGEARAMLDRVAALEGHELRISALNTLLLLDINTDHEAAAEHRERLEALLEGPLASTPKQALEGRLLIALSYALEGELGPTFERALALVPTPTNDDQRSFYDQIMPVITNIASAASVALPDRSPPL